jgi:hypothetical protein
MSTTNQYIEVINKIKPKNGLTFKLIDGCDIEDILNAPVELDLDEGSSSGSTIITLGGYISDNIVKLNGDITSHIDAKDNPHNVQVAQLDQTGANTAYNKDFEDDATVIQMNGDADVGKATTIARADHVHPTDTTRASVDELEKTNTALSNLTSQVSGHIAEYNTHKAQSDKAITDNKGAIDDLTTTFEAYKEDTGLTIDGINWNIADLTETINANKKAVDDYHTGREAAVNKQFTDVGTSIETLENGLGELNTAYDEYVAKRDTEHELINKALTDHTNNINQINNNIGTLTATIADEQFLQQQELDNRVTILTVAVEAKQEICLTFCNEETTIRIDWGDGEGVTSCIIEASDGDPTTTITHEYTNKGKYECKIYGMKYLCPTFLTESPVGISATLGLLDAISLNKELNLTKAQNNSATFKGCPVKILVPFAELATYENAGLGEHFDAIARVNDIKSWVMSNINGWILEYIRNNTTTLDEIITEQN